MIKRLQRYFLEGIALVGPIGATFWVLWWLFNRLDRILGGLFDPILGRPIPGLGLMALLVVLVLTGFLTERTLGRRLTRFWEWVVDKVPIARPVYKGSRQLFQSLVGQEARAFQKAVLCEYPSPGMWAVAFVTGDAPAGAAAVLEGEKGVIVFLPTAPNPMSGFLLILPKSKVRELAVSTETAFTFVVSMGSVPLADDPVTAARQIRAANAAKK